MASSVRNLPDKSNSRRDQTPNLFFKQLVWSQWIIRNLCTQPPRIDATRRFPKNRPCRNVSRSYDCIDRDIGFGKGSASERLDKLVPTNSNLEIMSLRLSLIPAFSQRMRHLEVGSDKGKRCDFLWDATRTATSAGRKSALFIRSS